jgi:hypothetical protein
VPPLTLAVSFLIQNQKLSHELRESALLSLMRTATEFEGKENQNKSAQRS